MVPASSKTNFKTANSDSEQVQEVVVENLSLESPEHLPVPVPYPPAVEAPRPARAKPWTADERQTVRDCGSAYMEDDTPPDNFPSNCELAAGGHSAAEVIECLDRRFAKKRYRPGGRYGPRMWNWFYTVIREHFSATERGHLPEPTRRAPGIYLDAQNQTKAQDLSGDTRPEKLPASQR